MTGIAAPVWPDESTILGFSRRDDGSLSLRTADISTGSVRDTGAHIPPGTAQGSRLAARWDVEHGRALLLARFAAGGTEQSASGLQAWLVSFVPSTEVRP